MIMSGLYISRAVVVEERNVYKSVEHATNGSQTLPMFITCIITGFAEQPIYEYEKHRKAGHSDIKNKL